LNIFLRPSAADQLSLAPNRPNLSKRKDLDMSLAIITLLQFFVLACDPDLKMTVVERPKWSKIDQAQGDFL
jgi:hypothetical protein